MLPRGRKSFLLAQVFSSFLLKQGRSRKRSRLQARPVLTPTATCCGSIKKPFPPPAPQFLGQSEQSSGCCSNFVVLVFNGGWGLPPSPDPLHSPGPFPAPFCRVGGGWKHRPALRVTAGREHSWKGTEGTFSSSPSPGCSLPEVFAPQASLRSKRGVLQPRARPPKQGLNNCPDLRRVVGRSFAVPARMILWLISQ